MAVLTVTISNEMIKRIDAVRKSEARASYIRRAIDEKLERERAEQMKAEQAQK